MATNRIKSCDHPPRRVIDLDECQVWASQRWYAPDPPADLVRLNCTGEATGRSDVGRFRMLRGLVRPSPEEILLDWPDGGVPPVGLDFWKALPEAITAHGAKGMLVYCLGSHGRTGTALAALRIARGLSPSKAIRWVRKRHCHNAIETYGQESYLYRLAGQDPPPVPKTKAHPDHHSNISQYPGSAGYKYQKGSDGVWRYTETSEDAKADTTTDLKSSLVLNMNDGGWIQDANGEEYWAYGETWHDAVKASIRVETNAGDLVAVLGPDTPQAIDDGIWVCSYCGESCSGSLLAHQAECDLGRYWDAYT